MMVNAKQSTLCILVTLLLASSSAVFSDVLDRNVTGLSGCQELEANEDIAASIERIQAFANEFGIYASVDPGSEECGYRLSDPRLGSRMLFGAYTDVELRTEMENFFGLQIKP